MTEENGKPEWIEKFDWNPPKKLGGLRRFERHYFDAVRWMYAQQENPVGLDGQLGDATLYLCAAIDAGLIKSPEASREDDVYTIDGIDVMNADVEHYQKILYYGRTVSRVMKELTTVPFD